VSRVVRAVKAARAVRARHAQVGAQARESAGDGRRLQLQPLSAPLALPTASTASSRKTSCLGDICMGIRGRSRSRQAVAFARRF
jgi:hypothetical protein